MNIKTPRDFFEQTLPEKFDRVKAGSLDATIQMNITGSEGGNWTIIIRDRKLEIKEGVHPFPDIAVKIEDKDFVDLINGKLNAIAGFMAGKIHFSGSLSLGMRLVDLGIM